LHSWDGYKLIVQFKAGLDGETVHAGGVAEHIELQGGIRFTFQGDGTKKFVGDDNRGLPTIFNHLRDSVRVPCAKAFDHNTSAFFGNLRHVTVILEGQRYFLA
jgi:hypothetical protein